MRLLEAGGFEFILETEDMHGGAHSSETGPAAATLRRNGALTRQLPLICRPERLLSNFSCLHYFFCVCQPNQREAATSCLWGFSAALPQSPEKLAILELMEGLQRATHIIPPSNPSGPDAILVTTFTWQLQTIQMRIIGNGGWREKGKDRVSQLKGLVSKSWSQVNNETFPAQVFWSDFFSLFGSCCTFGLESGCIYLPGNPPLLLELVSVQLKFTSLSLLRAVVLGNEKA